MADIAFLCACIFSLIAKNARSVSFETDTSFVPYISALKDGALRHKVVKLRHKLVCFVLRPHSLLCFSFSRSDVTLKELPGLIWWPRFFLLILLIIVAITIFSKVPLRSVILSFAASTYVMVSASLIAYKKEKWVLIIHSPIMLYAVVMFYVNILSRGI